MADKNFKKLIICIENELGEDIVIIFAEPSQKDICQLIKDECVLDHVNNILWTKDYVVEKTKNMKEDQMKKWENVWIDSWNTEVKRRDDKFHFQEKVFDAQNKDLDDDISYDGEGEINEDDKLDLEDLVINKIEGFPDMNKGEVNDEDKEDNDNISSAIEDDLNIEIKGELIANETDEVREEDIGDLSLHSQRIRTKSKLFIPDIKFKKRKQTKKIKKNACGICGKVMGFYNLKVHLISHTGEKPFSCEVCGKSFLQKRDLKRHELIHTSEKEFICEVCGKSFLLKSDLKRHELIHTGEKPYSCDVCGRGLISKSDLTKHKRTHTGSKPYSCNICTKLFTQSNDLNRHRLFHTGQRPYSCNICGRAFTLSYHLTEHLRIHTGEKPYSCDICEKAFTNIGGLTKHKRIHSGEKPYSCDICKKSFTQSQNLTRHRKICTAVKDHFK